MSTTKWAASLDPDEELDFSVDWASRLDDGDAISSYEFVVPSPLIKGTTTRDGTVLTVWLSGGESGTTYDVVSRVVTTAGRTREQTIKLRVRDK